MRYSGTDMSAEEIGKALNCIGGIVVWTAASSLSHGSSSWSQLHVLFRVRPTSDRL